VRIVVAARLVETEGVVSLMVGSILLRVVLFEVVDQAMAFDDDLFAFAMHRLDHEDRKSVV